MMKFLLRITPFYMSWSTGLAIIGLAAAPLVFTIVLN
jgi:hypothetical protein